MNPTLSPNREGFTHLLSAAQKSRSIAAEGGYRDLLSDQNIGGIKIPGLDRWLGDDRTIGLLADLASGTRECDRALWLNLANMVRSSLSWQGSLDWRGVRMPTPAEVLETDFGLELAS